MKIGSKIFLITLGSMIFAIGIICLSIYITEESTKTDIESDLDNKMTKATETELSNISQDFYTMCSLQQGLLKKILSGSLSYAEDFAKINGGFNLGSKKVTWTAVNQFTKDSTKIELPAMNIGNIWLGQNSSFNNHSYLVDDVINKFGVTCTIFQRMNPSGDMLRVCTNIKKLDGKRAIGTYIPSSNPDGSKNNVISTVLNGTTYFARAYVVNAWYITIYKPITNSQGDTIGVLYVGIKQDTAQDFNASIKNFSLPNNGYAFVTNGKNSREFSGKVIFHKTNSEIGKKLLSENTNNSDVISASINSAIAAGNGKSRTITGKISSSVNNKTKEIIASSIYFEPFDWVITIISDKHDFSDIIAVVGNSLSKLFIEVIAMGLLVLIVSALITVFVVRGIVKPISKAVEIANAIAEGDITLRMNHKSKDEVGELSNSFDKMLTHLERNSVATQNIATGNLKQTIDISSNKDLFGISLSKMLDSLNEVLGQTKTAAKHTSIAANEINAASTNLSTNTQRSINNLDIVCDQLEDIDKQAKNAAEIASKTQEYTEEVMSAAKYGNNGMEEMVNAMQDIQESSDSITKIIKTIDDLAFQTNLLALNAAVESARAGKHGKGFAVVAEEVRSLAARSAKAASETSALVLESKEKVTLGARIAANTKEDLTKINHSVDQVIGLIKTLSSESIDQRDKIEAVNNGVQTLKEIVMSNTAAAEETSSTSVELAAQAKSLDELLSHFSIKDNTTQRLKHIEHPNNILEITDSYFQQSKASLTSPKDQILLDSEEFGKF